MRYKGTPILAFDSDSQRNMIDALSELCHLQLVEPKVFLLPTPMSEDAASEHNALHEESALALRSSSLSRYVALDLSSGDGEPQTLAAAVAFCLVTQAELLVVVSEKGELPMVFRQLLQVNEAEDYGELLSLADRLLAKEHEDRHMVVPLSVSFSFPVESEAGSAQETADVVKFAQLARDRAKQIYPVPDHVMLHAMAAIKSPKPGSSQEV